MGLVVFTIPSECECAIDEYEGYGIREGGDVCDWMAIGVGGVVAVFSGDVLSLGAGVISPVAGRVASVGGVMVVVPRSALIGARTCCSAKAQIHVWKSIPAQLL